VTRLEIGPLEEHVARADRLPEVDDGAIPFVVIGVAEVTRGGAAPGQYRPMSVGQRRWPKRCPESRTFSGGAGAGDAGDSETGDGERRRFIAGSVETFSHSPFLMANALLTTSVPRSPRF
jgi:hypothetical protein